MDNRLRSNSSIYVYAGYLALLSALVFNPFTIPYLQSAGIVPVLKENLMHGRDILVFLPLSFDLIAIVTGVLAIWGKERLPHYLNNSGLYNAFLFLCFLLLLFSSNVVLPGTVKWLRILLLLVLIFLLTNTLYLYFIKKRERSPHSFYKNLALAVYSTLLILLVLEGVFMFFRATHRFNGTLASQSWFIRYWELNEEGYRDRMPAPEEVAGKRKVMVLGDSFVAGHGITKVENRFSDLLADKLDERDVVFNLGVGGSDVLDAYQRLRDFPYQPDLLVFSYYPNDIEQDGVRAGLEMARAQSYSDLRLPLRYFFRRSYLLNNIYWRFPHGQEMAGFKSYIEQCYENPKVMELHTAHLDSITNYVDSLGIPMLAVVWPFLERVEWSSFATEPIVGYFEARSIYVLDMRNLLLGRDPGELIVNQNDSHPNEAVNAELADTLYKAMRDLMLLE